MQVTPKLQKPPNVSSNMFSLSQSMPKLLDVTRLAMVPIIYHYLTLFLCEKIRAIDNVRSHTAPAFAHLARQSFHLTPYYYQKHFILRVFIF